MNSVTDPGGSVSATAPYGYDQLATLYNRYRVLASAIKVKALHPPSNAVTADTFRIVCWPSRDTTSFVSDLMGAVQQPYGKSLDITMPYYNTFGDASTIKNYISLSKLSGASPTEVAVDTQFQAGFGANPARVYYWNILVCTQSGTESFTVDCEVEMIQYAVLNERLQLAST